MRYYYYIYMYNVYENEKETRNKKAKNMKLIEQKERVTHLFYWWPTREYFIS